MTPLCLYDSRKVNLAQLPLLLSNCFILLQIVGFLSRLVMPSGPRTRMFSGLFGRWLWVVTMGVFWGRLFHE
ncbi:hypothetical protein M441DRAFT_208389 [Trichoderma asperellum CBS 433.97]|uniref:Uncharacterized protein n=1 Tax=Trichoderma asperellum (strain ATCC 204424 / CBS 433.97 / NBRC 101777) TaxID=1042311 RepID=A0A2T3ZMN1_TRIA4|nr:hypothetical protein M441DRAFT_208389 [Trichoderma asperellum CBS 433.97]PTB46056.1 hypothetical protein M441DRAFT_208389 [Trichoderma asperellum CBS 433.97]